MSPPFAPLRRALGRVLAGGSTGLRHRGGGGDSQLLCAVPVTVRECTADGADLRILLDARISTATLPREEAERIILALVVPATGAWVRRQRLAGLDDSLGPRLRVVEEEVCHPARELGVDLLALDVVAVEHLLVSPSADEPTGADHTTTNDVSWKGGIDAR